MAIGSQRTMTELVRLETLVAHRDLYGDICIEPTDEVQRMQAKTGRG
jgi:hypothetical protein